MQVDDLNMQMDSILEEVKNTILRNSGDYIKKDQIKMRLCYPTIKNKSNLKFDFLPAKFFEF